MAGQKYIQSVISAELKHALDLWFTGGEKSCTAGDGKSVNYLEADLTGKRLVGFKLYETYEGFWLSVTPPGPMHYWQDPEMQAWVVNQLRSPAGVEWMLGRTYSYADHGGPTQAALVAAKELIEFLSVFTLLQRAVNGGEAVSAP